ncbi:MAG: hypothetical protein HDP34_02725 [Clostridia bacterium]|nr:hypothetical protein [Clostridia bacterium]
MKDNEQAKRCGNCRYFIWHYIKHPCGFHKIGIGHCVNDELKRKISRKFFETDKACDYWEEAALQTEERKQKIESLLRGMAKRLEEIAEVFEYDNLNK